MIGGSKTAQNIDISDLLINFNSGEWANQANSYLQNALTEGIQYSERYNQAAIDASKAYQQQAVQAQREGFERAQALNAPQRLAGYNALDTYLGTLGQATPVGGSFQLAQGMQNSLLGQPNTPLQQQQVQGFNQGLLQGGNQ